MQTIKCIRITNPTTIVINEFSSISGGVDIFIDNIHTNRLKINDTDSWDINLIVSFYSTFNGKDITNICSIIFNTIYNVNVPTVDLKNINEHIMDYLYTRLLNKLSSMYNQYTFSIVKF